jgi:threonine/homoserine/homoserine lactone efflux protein
LTREASAARYLVTTALALVAAVYLASQIVAPVVKLLVVIAAIFIGVRTWRAWRESSRQA